MEAFTNVQLLIMKDKFFIKPHYDIGIPNIDFHRDAFIYLCVKLFELGCVIDTGQCNQ